MQTHPEKKHLWKIELPKRQFEEEKQQELSKNNENEKIVVTRRAPKQLKRSQVCNSENGQRFSFIGNAKRVSHEITIRIIQSVKLKQFNFERPGFRHVIHTCIITRHFKKIKLQVIITHLIIQQACMQKHKPSQLSFIENTQDIKSLARTLRTSLQPREIMIPQLITLASLKSIFCIKLKPHSSLTSEHRLCIELKHHSSFTLECRLYKQRFSSFQSFTSATLDNSSS